MPDNRVVVYKGPGQVAVESIDYPKLELPSDVVNGLGIARKAPHAAILKIVTTNICGSDQHMVRGRTTAPVGQSLGHEITGEIVEVGDDVLFAKVGDICSVPFNIACGRCRMCNEGKTGVCLNVNPARPGAAYGYVDMGGWIGGQAEYVMVPFADFNLLRFPDRDQALEKILDLTMLSDIFPTGYHGAVTAGVTTGSTVYVAGAGPVGLAAAHAAQLLGAAAVVVGDMIPERLAQARSFGCETVDLSADGTLAEQLEQLLGEPEVDAAVDAVGFEARGHGRDAGEAPATVLNSVMEGDPGRRRARHPGALRHRRPRCRRRQGQGGHPGRADRAGLGEVAQPHHRSVPGEEVQPAADAGDPVRPGSDREGGQRDHDLAGRRPARLPGVRRRRGPQVRDRPARQRRGVRSAGSGAAEAVPGPAQPSCPAPAARR